MGLKYFPYSNLAMIKVPFPYKPRGFPSLPVFQESTFLAGQGQGFIFVPKYFFVKERKNGKMR